MQNSLHFDELFDTKFKIQNPQNPEYSTLPENSSNFVYILTEEYRTSFILTQKIQNQFLPFPIGILHTWNVLPKWQPK